MAGYWLKLYTEILDDPKYYRLSDDAKLGMYELMLVAKKVGQDGHLPSIDDIVFYTRRSADWWMPVIEELKGIVFIVMNGSSDKIRKFEERQMAVTSNERQQQYRKALHENEFSGDENKKMCNENVTNLSRNVTESKSKSTEIDADVEVDADSGGGLISTFLELYPGLKPRISSDWQDGYEELNKNHITPEIMRRAASELAQKGMKVISPGSLLRPCLMVMQREKRRMPDSSGQFKEYINH